MSELRACILCSLVKPYDKFKEEGCDNCEAQLQLQSSSERVQDCTTTRFSG